MAELKTQPNGASVDEFRTGFSPRKQKRTLYIMACFDPYGAILFILSIHVENALCHQRSSYE